MELKNKRILITGGARIGKTVAEKLALKGADVSLVYRHSRRAAEETQQRVLRAGRKSFILKSDVRNSSQVKKLFQALKKKWGGLDVLINMASIYKPVSFLNQSEKTWSDDIESNLKSVFLCSLEAAKIFPRTGGRIINFSDWVSVSGRPRYKKFLSYYTAKAGVKGLTESLALELAPTVLVNSIAPGPILPPKALSNEETREIKKVTPLQKWGGSEEIAKAVQFLIETDFVTGECIRVDGGRHLF